jgi:methyl-accepting chemotaxis protein
MKARSELGQLLKALHVMEKQLLQVVTTVRTGAQQLHQESIGIALRNQDLTQRTQDNAVGLEEITASVHALSDVVHNTAKNAAQVELLTITAYENSSSGLQEINSVVSAMQQIEQYSSRINSIVVLMEEISSTTNLLALNAELEAARAGQAGSGFAVVATEIRHLAARSAASMVEIKQLVGDTTEAITTGSHLVQQAGQALADIERTVRDVRTHILGIATSTRDQEFGIQEIMRVLDTLTEATAQNAVLVQQMACASEILDGQAAALKTETDYFTLVDE